MRCRVNSKTTRTVFGSLLAVGTMWAAAWAVDKPELLPISGKINWVFDYEEGKQLSRTSGKPMFVVFRCER